jgi:predicted ATPase with chaperone activity
VGIFAAAALGWATLGAAQAPPPEQAPPAQTVQVDDKQVKAFAKAQQQVTRISRDVNQRLQKVESPEEGQTIQSEAQQEMADAVVDAGLTVQEFNRIAQAAQADQDLRQRLEAELEKISSERS